jgi:HSP20 family molecular chaperone IbpA
MGKKTPTSNTDIQTTRDSEEMAMTTRESSRYMAPPVDIYETEEGMFVLVDLPGVDKKDFNVRVDNGLLTIQGKPTYDPPKNPLHEEFRLIDFYRQFQLSEDVDQTKISAKAEQGVLTIFLPKAEKAKPRKIQVDVKT